ncbi:hypothetical protein KKI24_28875 [bacterium]|nr:hypothetical protein [bacterium]
MKKIRILIGELGVAPSDGYTAQELYEAYGSLVRTQEQENLLCQPMSLHEFNEHYNPGVINCTSIIQEAISFKSYAALKRGIQNLGKKMSEALGNSEITLVGHTKPEELKPRKNKLFAYVAVQYDFSDGQSVKVLFHSPNGEARSFDVEDELVSYAHTLNGRDVTHLFADREGLTTQKFSMKMMQLLEKNHDKFVARQKTNEENQAALEAQTAANEDLALKVEALDTEIKMKQLENDGLLEAVNTMQGQIEEKQVSIANLNDQIAMAKSEREAQMKAKTDEAEKATGPAAPDFSQQANELTTVSSGTFSGLTGIKDYSEQQSITQGWRDWVLQELTTGKTFSNWQDAWTQFESTLPEDDGTGEDVPGPSADDTGNEPDLPNAEPDLPNAEPESEGPTAAVETANAILAGEYDDDPKELEREFEHIMDELEEKDPDLLEKVSDYYTELLSKLATVG